jgi:23S rRNA (adenine2503-C2)-methyltransferase
MEFKDKLFGLKRDELAKLVLELGYQQFYGRQIAEWLYKSNIRTIDEMTNLSKSARALLNDKYDLGIYDPENVQTSADGTKKYLFPTHKGMFVETAYIPEVNRATVCISSQIGCKMGCRFCMTGQQGFQGQLTAGEILNQLRSLPEKSTITNVVYMGMGEPFDNLINVLDSLEILTADWGFGMSSKRITVSTIGIIPGMKEFLEKSKCHLAVSLHSPLEEERKDLMPIGKIYPLRQVLDTIRSFNLGRQRRISFEYILFKDLNDTVSHVKELARLLNGIHCRINLIRYHPIPGISLQPSDDVTIIKFENALKSKGIRTTLRASRGQDIFAACGLLSTKELLR